MTVPVEAVQPVAQTDPTHELEMVPPTEEATAAFQKGFEHMETGMQMSMAQAVVQIDKLQMGIVSSNIQAAKEILDRDD